MFIAGFSLFLYNVILSYLITDVKRVTNVQEAPDGFWSNVPIIGKYMDKEAATKDFAVYNEFSELMLVLNTIINMILLLPNILQLQRVQKKYSAHEVQREQWDDTSEAGDMGVLLIEDLMKEAEEHVQVVPIERFGDGI